MIAVSSVMRDCSHAAASRLIKVGVRGNFLTLQSSDRDIIDAQNFNFHLSHCYSIAWDRL